MSPSDLDHCEQAAASAAASADPYDCDRQWLRAFDAAAMQLGYGYTAGAPCYCAGGATEHRPECGLAKGE